MTNLLFLTTILLISYLTVRSWRHSGIGLAMIWSMYGLEQYLQFTSRFFLQRGSLVNFATVGIAIAAILLAHLRGRVKHLNITTAHFWWLGLMLLVVASLQWTIYKNADEVIFNALPYITGFVIVGPLCIYNDEQIDKAIETTIYLGGFVLLGMLWCTFGNRALVLGIDSRGNLVEGNPLALGSYGSYVTICCLFSMFKRRIASVQTAIMIAAAVLGLYITVRSGSRGQLVATIFACIVWLPMAGGITFKKTNLLLIIVAGIVIFFGVSFIEEAGMARRWSYTNLLEARDGRLAATTAVMDRYIQAGPLRWVFGLGTSASYRIIGIYPHVVPAEVLFEEGLLGLALFCGFLTTVVYAGLRCVRSKQFAAEARVNICALLAIFTFEFALCLKQGSLLGSPAVFSIGLCIAIVAKNLYRDSKRQPQPTMQFRTAVVPPQASRPPGSYRGY